MSENDRQSAGTSQKPRVMLDPEEAERIAGQLEQLYYLTKEDVYEITARDAAEDAMMIRNRGNIDPNPELTTMNENNRQGSETAHPSEPDIIHKDELTADELEHIATNTVVDMQTAYALAVCVREDEYTPAEAAEALRYCERNEELDFLTSKHYPGDAAYDTAAIRYGGFDG